MEQVVTMVKSYPIETLEKVMDIIKRLEWDTPESSRFRYINICVDIRLNSYSLYDRYDNPVFVEELVEASSMIIPVYERP